MSGINTGGPAFPLEYFDKQLSQNRVLTGMTLRDYFAAKAMQALVTSQHCPKKFDGLIVSQAAYRVADAMLAARSLPSGRRHAGRKERDMIPTMHLRFIERLEIIPSKPGDEFSTSRKVRVLQQFWEHPNGKDAAGDMFRIVMGTWRDVPLEVEQ